MHCSDYNELTSNTDNNPGLILGATNPFFCKVLEHMTNILTIGNLSDMDDDIVNMGDIEAKPEEKK